MVGRSTSRGAPHASSGTIGDLEDLAVFVEVARQRSFAEAARRLRLPTSNVSRAIARLERDLGVPLLRRTSRRVAITTDGDHLLAEAAAHIEGLRDALAGVADRRPEPSGVVRVTAPAFTGATRVADALAAFARAHPKITIELDASNALRDLIHDGYDFGIRVGPHVDADFTARRWLQGQSALFASRDFVHRELRDRRTLTRAVLERAPCIVLRTPITWRFVDPAGAGAELVPTPRFVINDPRSAVDAARHGLGIVLAPLAAVPARALVKLSTELGEPRPTDLYIVYPARRFLPVRARLAIDWLLGRPT